MIVGLWFPLLGAGLSSCWDAQVNSEPSPLEILVLGGTSFPDPHQVVCAVLRGHKVATFARGKTKPTVHKRSF